MIEGLLVAIIIILAIKLMIKTNKKPFKSDYLSNIQITLLNEEFNLIELKFIKLLNKRSNSIFSDYMKKTCILIEFNNIDSNVSIDNFNFLLNIVKSISTKSKIIDKLIIKITSPGGSIMDFAEMYNILKSIKNDSNIEIIISIDKICTSCGYLIASLGNEICATELATIGSIGIMVENFNIENLMKTVGIEYLTLKSGKMKNPINPYESPNIDSINFVQTQVNKNFEIFYKMIESNRKDKLNNIKLIKSGSTFYGIEALDIGLIDNICSTYDLINKYLPSHNIYKLNLNESYKSSSNIFLKYIKMFININ